MEFGRRLSWLYHDPIAELNVIKLEKIAAGSELFDLSMINPDIQPPRYLLDRLVEASLKPHLHRYAVSRGIRKLREAFAQKYATRFGVELDPEVNVCATMGSKDAILQALRCLASPGAKVLLPAPTYPAYLSAARLSGLQVEFYELSRDLEQMLRRISLKLEQTDCEVVLTNFPNNPTGISVNRDFYTELVSICKKNDAFLVNDFVYGEMAYDGAMNDSLLSSEPSLSNVAEVYSLSKAYCVPGWRVGGVCGDKRVVGLLSRLKSRVDYGLFLPIQMAAASALTVAEDLVSPTTEEYQKRCALLMEGLQKQGWELTCPSSAASVWARIPEEILSLHNDQGSRSISFTKELLSRHGVLLLPGVLFGEGYDNFVRFALVRNDDGLREVLHRIEMYYQAKPVAIETAR